MCFSATASFVTAGTTAIIGVVALTRANGPRELPLAATPILFALQQGIEGLLWLDLPVAPDGPLSTGLTLLYLFFAEVFWPIFVPIAVLLVEPEVCAVVVRNQVAARIFRQLELNTDIRHFILLDETVDLQRR